MESRLVPLHLILLEVFDCEYKLLFPRQHPGTAFFAKTVKLRPTTESIQSNHMIIPNPQQLRKV